jgi:hypothetical protein
MMDSICYSEKLVPTYQVTRFITRTVTIRIFSPVKSSGLHMCGAIFIGLASDVKLQQIAALDLPDICICFTESHKESGILSASL